MSSRQLDEEADLPCCPGPLQAGIVLSISTRSAPVTKPFATASKRC